MAVSAPPVINAVESGAVGGGGGGSSGAAELPQQVTSMAIGMSMERTLGGDGVGGIEKKKRGRPRKYSPPDGSMALQLSSPGFSPSSSEFSPKRGRGRPPGSGKRQLLAALG